MRRVDDTLGVFHTHGVAGLTGGLLVGLFANPKMIVYLGVGKAPAVTTAGLLYGNPRQLWVQAGAALTVIVWDGLVTFVILKVLSIFMKLRMPDDVLEIGDVAVHEEEVYPPDAMAAAGVSAGATSSASSGRDVPTSRDLPIE
jgi:Amt family ammonium transporter